LATVASLKAVKPLVIMKSISLYAEESDERFHASFDSLWVEPTDVEIFAQGLYDANPYVLCGLAAVSHWLISQGFSVTLNAPTASRHLDEMDFYLALPDKVRVAGRSTASYQPNWKAILPVRNVRSTSDINSVVREFIDYGREAKNWLRGISTKIAETCLGEGLDNAREHASSTLGIFAGAWAYHDDGPLCLAVVDLGMGIPNHLRRSPKYCELSDEDALRQAVQQRVSGVDDPHRGFGLPNIRQAASESGRKSVVAIRAGEAQLKAYFDRGKTKREIESTAWVPGTWIRIEISR